MVQWVEAPWSCREGGTEEGITQHHQGAPESAHSPAAELSTQLSHSHRLHKSLSQIPICEQTKLSRREKPSQWRYRHITLRQMELNGTLGVPLPELSIAPRDCSATL